MVQIYSLLATPSSVSSDGSLEGVPKTIDEDQDRSNDQLLEKLQVVHEPLSNTKTDGREFLRR